MAALSVGNGLGLQVERGKDDLSVREIQGQSPQIRKPSVKTQNIRIPHLTKRDPGRRLESKDKKSRSQSERSRAKAKVKR